MKVLFVHHSIGRYCIENGLRSRLEQCRVAVELWDVDYARYGVHDEKGKSVATSDIRVPDDNTNPDGLGVFVERVLLSSPQRGSAIGSQFEAVILKSCYTGARIRTDEVLKNYIESSRRMVERLDAAAYPTLVLTPVPDSPVYSSSATARRALEYAQSVTSIVAAEGAVRVINLHTLLADRNGFLLPQFRKLGGLNAHPNAEGITALIDIITSGISALASCAPRYSH